MYNSINPNVARDTLVAIHRCCDIYAELHDLKNMGPDYDSLIHKICTRELNASDKLGNEQTNRALDIDSISKKISINHYSDSYKDQYDRLLELLAESIAHSYENPAVAVDLKDHSYNANSWHKKTSDHVKNIMIAIDECFETPDSDHLSELKLNLNLLLRVESIFKDNTLERQRITDFADYINETGLKLFQEKNTDHKIITQLAKKSLRKVELSLEQST